MQLFKIVIFKIIFIETVIPNRPNKCHDQSLEWSNKCEGIVLFVNAL